METLLKNSKAIIRCFNKKVIKEGNARVFQDIKH
ncbi:hypothetical protein SAMN05421821_108177 [Mucilaginibacter lappiensis]|uniref:Uncharacterized protein n=1 Tax=Mucilaginibacter lappiensis TaxID=354630 RepID=A0ABR6PK49_9SPHI|nr:hypothetical protein [Mucilaginibacter lappiensis]SIR55337.1 hypothetical protein SAMN05421821_108177 [Mucilaginibacter lappiensis]